jgi:hypothetical protein
MWASLALWIEVREMHINSRDVPAEKDPGEIFTIAGWPMEIYYMILPGTGTGSDVKLGWVSEILDWVAGDLFSACQYFPPPLADKVRTI